MQFTIDLSSALQSWSLGPSRSISAGRRRARKLLKEVAAADVIYRGGNVITMDERNSLAESVATKNGTILAVGPESAVMEHARPETVNSLR